MAPRRGTRLRAKPIAKLPAMQAYDGSAALVVPIPVERLPLYRWRPGTRLLNVGSRDGTAFDGAVERAEAATFHRPVDAALLAGLRAKLGLAGIACTWSESLAFPAGLAAARAAGGHLVVATAGHGEAALLADLLPAVDAWLLVTGRHPGPLAAAILAGGRHVEVLVGLDGDRLPDLDWSRPAAVHLTGHRAAAADDLDAWCAAVRAAWPHAAALHDDHHPHSDCLCGERLVWRHGSRSRCDALDPASGRCRACGRPAGFVTG